MKKDSLVCRVYTQETDDIDALIDAMDACVKMKLPFYYSGKHRVIRVQSRSLSKMNRIRREFHQLRLKTYTTFI